MFSPQHCAFAHAMPCLDHFTFYLHIICNNYICFSLNISSSEKPSPSTMPRFLKPLPGTRALTALWQSCPVSALSHFLDYEPMGAETSIVPETELTINIHGF